MRARRRKVETDPGEAATEGTLPAVFRNMSLFLSMEKKPTKSKSKATREEGVGTCQGTEGGGCGPTVIIKSTPVRARLPGLESWPQHLQAV